MTAIPFLAGDYPVTQPYGPTDFTAEPAAHGFTHFHTGEDFGAPAGTPVLSGPGGTIAYAGPLGGYGNAVEEVLPGGGLEVLLGHLSSILVSAGQQVGPGVELGTVGSTGNSTGPHLHEEVRSSPFTFGSDVDPESVSLGVGGWQQPLPSGGNQRVQPGARAGNGAPITVPDPFGIGAGLGTLSQSIADVPVTLGHGIADFISAGTHNIEVALQRQLVALAVAAVVLLVLFL